MYNFKTSEQIQADKDDFEKNGGGKFNSNSEYPLSFMERNLYLYKYDASDVWGHLKRMDDLSRADLIILLCDNGNLYNDKKGHFKGTYRLAKSIRYQFSDKQREVCYNILNEFNYDLDEYRIKINECIHRNDEEYDNLKYEALTDYRKNIFNLLNKEREKDGKDLFTVAYFKNLYKKIEPVINYDSKNMTDKIIQDKFSDAELVKKLLQINDAIK